MQSDGPMAAGTFSDITIRKSRHIDNKKQWDICT